MKKKVTSIHDFLEQAKDMTPTQAGKEFYGLTEKEINEILSKKTEVSKTEIETTKSTEEESNEIMSSKLPSAVSKQGKDAVEYFFKNKEVSHSNVIVEVQKLGKKGLIQYKDTGNGTYEVHFNLPGCKLKRYMPPDTSIADSSYIYDLWDDTKITQITQQETTRKRLRSDEGKKYLTDKEKNEKKSLISKENFLKLGKALYPNGTEEEQILAIMIATGFYGYMWLSDKTSEYQLAVNCYLHSDDRSFFKLSFDLSSCSIIYTSTL